MSTSVALRALLEIVGSRLNTIQVPNLTSDAYVWKGKLGRREIVMGASKGIWEEELLASILIVVTQRNLARGRACGFLKLFGRGGG